MSKTLITPSPCVLPARSASKPTMPYRAPRSTNAVEFQTTSARRLVGTIGSVVFTPSGSTLPTTARAGCR